MPRNGCVVFGTLKVWKGSIFFFDWMCLFIMSVNKESSVHWSIWITKIQHYVQGNHWLSQRLVVVFPPKC